MSKKHRHQEGTNESEMEDVAVTVSEDEVIQLEPQPEPEPEPQPEPTDDELEECVFSALDRYEDAQKALASAQATALMRAVETKRRIPKKGELIEFFVEKEHGQLQGVVAEVLFAHSPEVVTLVASKVDGARHTHANVRKVRPGNPQPGQWDFRN